MGSVVIFPLMIILGPYILLVQALEQLYGALGQKVDLTPLTEAISDFATRLFVFYFNNLAG